MAERDTLDPLLVEPTTLRGIAASRWTWTLLGLVMGPMGSGGCFAEAQTVEPSAGSTGGAQLTTSSPTDDGEAGGMNSTTAAPDESADDETPVDTASESGSEPTATTTPGTEDDGPADSGPATACDDADSLVVYINFGGATLQGGVQDDAPNDITANDFLIGTWPAYANPDALDVFDAVVNYWAGYGVCITSEPPNRESFEMIVVQSEAVDGNPNTVSFGGTDCSDATSNNVELVFVAERNGLSVAVKAIAIAHFIGRILGLEAVDDPTDLMHEFIGTTMPTATFNDACTPLLPTADCAPVAGCDDDQQNAHAYLTSRF